MARKKKPPRAQYHEGDDAPAPADHASLTPDEHDLWTFVAASVEPLPLKDRVGDRDDLTAPLPPRRGPRRKSAKSAALAEPAIPGQRVPARDVSARQAPILPPPPLVAPVRHPRDPAAAPFDQRKAKKIARGREPIGARIDLHGLRQDDARARLAAFLRRAAANGIATVLVITGKGRDSDDPCAPFGLTLDRAPRGVLRRNVPRWLEEPELRALVVSWTTASARHGGDGALYVHVRRRR